MPSAPSPLLSKPTSANGSKDRCFDTFYRHSYVCYSSCSPSDCCIILGSLCKAPFTLKYSCQFFPSTGGIIIYIRYRHVETLFRSSQRMRSLLRLNTAAFITGLLTVLGVSMVGNFQVCTIRLSMPVLLASPH